MRLPRQLGRIFVAVSAVVGIGLLTGCPSGGGAKAGVGAIDELARGANSSADDVRAVVAAELRQGDASEQTAAKSLLDRLRATPRSFTGVPREDLAQACEMSEIAFSAAVAQTKVDIDKAVVARLFAPQEAKGMWDQLIAAMTKADREGRVLDLLEESFALCSALEVPN